MHFFGYCDYFGSGSGSEGIDTRIDVSEELEEWWYNALINKVKINQVVGKSLKAVDKIKLKHVLALKNRQFERGANKLSKVFSDPVRKPF